ncbi:hypothetical protein HYH03_010942 [Edaphochlamys debaryana]|uniref:Ysc84 actin-binding domain-containing protein n=1 Tax=Edaphochlamys debaryana TaxID=47281 RepID=A0A835XUN3_9CHLO|nr:hypothetical protein HYH03_010942 [Edaphochlamys debaryana]|eukprot:KAG2490548.1 hypothetical protein HYH03_010942 [Edaphochlamys debaryana]
MSPELSAAVDAASSSHDNPCTSEDELDDSLKARLEGDAKWAAELVGRLCTGGSGMPASLLRKCEGLAFVRVSKGAFGFTVAHGPGFVIRKVDQDAEGNARWSPPVFFMLNQIGMGLALGLQWVESCWVLMTRSAVEGFTLPRSNVGIDLSFAKTDEMSGIPAAVLGTCSVADRESGQDAPSHCYSLASGLLANFSFNGTDTAPSRSLNTQLYGDHPLPGVLAGELPPFAAMAPLYDKITDLARSAAEESTS